MGVLSRPLRLPSRSSERSVSLLPLPAPFSTPHTLLPARRSSTQRSLTGSPSLSRRLLRRLSLRAQLPSVSNLRLTPSPCNPVLPPPAPTTLRSRSVNRRSPKRCTTDFLSSLPVSLLNRSPLVFLSSQPLLLVPSPRPRRSVSNVTSLPRVRSPLRSTRSSS